jgi:hypothetical protein
MKLILTNETKRVRDPKSYMELVTLSSEAFSLGDKIELFKFYYVDSDGDIITVSSENDYQEAQ